MSQYRTSRFRPAQLLIAAVMLGAMVVASCSPGDDEVQTYAIAMADWWESTWEMSGYLDYRSREVLGFSDDRGSIYALQGQGREATVNLIYEGDWEPGVPLQFDDITIPPPVPSLWIFTGTPSAPDPPEQLAALHEALIDATRTALSVHAAAQREGLVTGIAIGFCTLEDLLSTETALIPRDLQMPDAVLAQIWAEALPLQQWVARGEPCDQGGRGAGAITMREDVDGFVGVFGNITDFIERCNSDFEPRTFDVENPSFDAVCKADRAAVGALRAVSEIWLRAVLKECGDAPGILLPFRTADALRACG